MWIEYKTDSPVCSHKLNKDQILKQIYKIKMNKLKIQEHGGSDNSMKLKEWWKKEEWEILRNKGPCMKWCMVMVEARFAYLHNVFLCST